MNLNKMEKLSIKKENKIEEENLFEERYQKEILPLIDALCPDDEKPEEFEERMRVDLEESLKKIQVAQGKLIEHDENKNLEETKAILISRIKAVLEDERRYQYKDNKKRPDSELVLRSKITLFLAGDYSDLQSKLKDYYSYSTGEKKIPSIKELDFKNLNHYLYSSFDYDYSKKRKLSEKELDELVKAGFGKQLATIWESNLKDYFKNVPESFLLELIKNNFFWLGNILENHSSQKKYSHKISGELILKGYGYLVLRNIERFDDSDTNYLKFLIINYEPEYPYHINDILKYFKKINLNKNEELEIIDFIFKHQIVTEKEFKNISETEIREKYEKIDNEIKNIIRPNEKWKDTLPEQLSEEDLEKLKKYIEDGYVTFFHSFSNYIQYFLKNNYDWFINQMVKNDQENLLLKFFKSVDQEKYAQKLIKQDNIIILQKLLKNNQFFKNKLSKETYQELFYFENFFNEPEIKKKEILQLIKETQSFTENEEIILFYVNKFKNLNNFDESILETRREFLEEFKKNTSIISKNQPIFIEDKATYKNICQSVYPKRNYNTYQYIDEYKDRNEDLDSYTFNKEGYQMRLSGVVGYKIKDSYSKNEELLSNYQNRIKNIKNLAINNENIVDFISQNLSETESKTLEGKIIEYIRKNNTDPKSIDLLLAYQLHGHYDQFIRESADRTDMYEKMEGKEYVMLSELSERYGDLMKETLKGIGKKINNSEDKALFIKDIGDEIKKGEKLSSKISNELSQVPEDKLTTVAIQKKVVKSIINTFQQIPLIKNIAETFAGSFTKENFSSFQDIFKEKIKEMFQEINNEVEIDVKELEILCQKIYGEIKSELDKYEEIKEIDENKKGEVKMFKERLIKGYFSKNRENAHARMVGDICIAVNYKMLENKNYFEFVLFDENRKKCVGTTMLLNMEEPEGKKYLLYCPNPSVDLVSQVSAEKLYKLITKEIINFAKENKFDGILVDKRHGHSTNRSGLFQTSLEKSVLCDEKNGDIIFNLKNKHELSSGYVYQNNLNAVWLS